MRRRTSLTAAGLAAVAALAIPAGTAAAPTTLEARMTGAHEVPGPGDPNGRGEATIKVRPAKRKLCFELEWHRIGNATAAHIHKGERGEAGNIKVVLFEDPAGLPPGAAVNDCVRKQKRRLLRRIARNPERFYVNVHNEEYPDGAIRGQLRESR